MIAAGLLAAAVSTARLPPVVYQAASRDYDVRLRIAPQLKTLPAGTYAALKARVVADFRIFEASAVKDMARYRRQLPTSVLARTPEVVRVEVDLVLQTPHLTGFIRRDYVDAHGAHPGSDLSGLLFDRQSGRRLAATDLLLDGADMAPLNAALAAAVKSAKASRGDPVTPDDGFVKPGQLTWSGGVDLSASHDLLVAFTSDKDGEVRGDLPVLATVAASSVADRAGGLQFLYSPYDIGAYAEGAYRVVLPWRMFATALKPQYRADFAGRPVSEPGSNPLLAFPADVPPVHPEVSGVE